MRKFGASTLSFVKLTVIFISDANLPVEDERGNLHQWDQVSEPQTNQSLPQELLIRLSSHLYWGVITHRCYTLLVNHPGSQTLDSQHSVSSLEPLVDAKQVNQPCRNHQLKSEHNLLTRHLTGFLTRPPETAMSFRGRKDSALDVKMLGKCFLTA